MHHTSNTISNPQYTGSVITVTTDAKEYKQAQYLFQNKHGVIEELLQFFIGIVDAELFKGVHLKQTT